MNLDKNADKKFVNEVKTAFSLADAESLISSWGLPVNYHGDDFFRCPSPFREGADDGNFKVSVSGSSVTYKDFARNEQKSSGDIFDLISYRMYNKAPNMNDCVQIARQLNKTFGLGVTEPDRQRPLTPQEKEHQKAVYALAAKYMSARWELAYRACGFERTLRAMEQYTDALALDDELFETLEKAMQMIDNDKSVYQSIADQPHTADSDAEEYRNAIQNMRDICGMLRDALTEYHSGSMTDPNGKTYDYQTYDPIHIANRDSLTIPNKADVLQPESSAMKAEWTRCEHMARWQMHESVVPGEKENCLANRRFSEKLKHDGTSIHGYAVQDFMAGRFPSEAISAASKARRCFTEKIQDLYTGILLRDRSSVEPIRKALEFLSKRSGSTREMDTARQLAAMDPVQIIRRREDSESQKETTQGMNLAEAAGVEQALHEMYDTVNHIEDIPVKEKERKQKLAEEQLKDSFDKKTYAQLKDFLPLEKYTALQERAKKGLSR